MNICPNKDIKICCVHLEYLIQVEFYKVTLVIFSKIRVNDVRLMIHAAIFSIIVSLIFVVLYYL